jgi:hypothetical protein
MDIPKEPKDGDYVAYIEKYIHGNQAAPGQVIPRHRQAVLSSSGASHEGEAAGTSAKAPAQGKRQRWQQFIAHAQAAQLERSKHAKGKHDAAASNTDATVASNEKASPADKMGLITKLKQPRPAVMGAIIAFALLWIVVRFLVAAPYFN